MSGHSKFANIKHKKEKNDAAKGKIFTRIGREIAVAVKEGGPDPNNNSKLKDIVAKAKEAGVIMTDAGATFPYKKDPKDSNIRIAPSFPELDELNKAMKLFTLCVKLVSVDKLLETM